MRGLRSLWMAGRWPSERSEIWVGDRSAKESLSLFARWSERMHGEKFKGRQPVSLNVEEWDEFANTSLTARGGLIDKAEICTH